MVADNIDTAPGPQVPEPEGEDEVVVEVRLRLRLRLKLRLRLMWYNLTVLSWLPLTNIAPPQVYRDRMWSVWPVMACTGEVYSLYRSVGV